MWKRTRSNLLIYTMLLLCACGDQSSILSEFKTVGSRGFAGVLKAEYENLANFAIEVEGENEVGEYFLKKARKAHYSSKPAPVSPEVVDVPEFSLPAIKRAHTMLVDALETKNIPGNQELLAMAQTRYDCWAIYRQAYRKKSDSFACREDFYTAISYLKMPEVSVNADQFNVYFGSNSTALDSNSFSIIRQAAAKYKQNDGHTILLNGLTDSKGDVTANRHLSQRRAMAVRNALLQSGVFLDDIQINAAGESEAKNEMSKNMSDNKLRRVEILFEKSRKRTGFITKISDAPGWDHASDM